MNQILTIALPKIIQKNIKQFNTLNQQKLHEKKGYFTFLGVGMVQR